MRWLFLEREIQNKYMNTKARGLELEVQGIILDKVKCCYISISFYFQQSFL